jgi:drug/metabolite transporter (DMT)-like permease
MKNKHAGVIFALIAVYIIWGSTYLAIRFGLESFPPFLMASGRFLVADVVLYAIVYFKNKTHPSLKQWPGIILTGTLLLAGGNGTVTYVQQSVSSGLAAMVIATTPIWAVSISHFFGHRSYVIEWVGLLIGLIGLILLNFDRNLYSNIGDMIALILATVSWALGSALNRKLKLPVGLMSSAAQMIAGGIVLLTISFFTGESLPTHVSTKAWTAWLYLIFFGSIIGFSAFIYLLSHTRPALAMSYAYVNPIIAVVLGIVFANETVSAIGWVALAVIVIGVALVIASNKNN